MKSMKTNKTKMAHLHMHSNYSVGDAVSKIQDIVKRVKEYGHEYFALTQHGNMCSLVQAYLQAKKQGVNHVPGCQFYYADQPVEQLKDKKNRQRHHITGLATSNQGLSSLVALNNIAHSDGFYYKPMITVDDIAKHNKGIIILSGCYSSVLSQSIWSAWKLKHIEEIISGTPIIDKINGHYIYNDRNNQNRKFKFEATDYKYYNIKAQRYITALKNILDDRFFLEIQDGGVKINVGELGQVDTQDIMRKATRNYGKRFNIKCVATQDAHYVNQNDAYFHQCLLAVFMNKKMTDQPYSQQNPKGRKTFSSREFWIKDADTIQQSFSKEQVEQSYQIVKDSKIHISIDSMRLPKFNKVPYGITNVEYLKKLCRRGWKKRKINELQKQQQQTYKNRVLMQLDVLEQVGIVDYFLLVWDVYQFCRSQGIPMGAARGCLGPNSIIKCSNGYKKIRDVQVGDLVLNKDGITSKVTNIHKYLCSEDLYVIKHSYSIREQPSMTLDHKVLALQNPFKNAERHYDNSLDYKSLGNIENLFNKDNLTWKSVAQLNNNDYIVRPIRKRGVVNMPIIDLSKYATSTSNIKYQVNANYIIQDKSINYPHPLAIKTVGKAINLSFSAIDNYKNNRPCRSSTKSKIEDYLNKNNISYSQFKNYTPTQKRYIKRFIDVNSDDFLYLLGFFIGDGWIANGDRDYVAFAFHCQNDISSFKRIQQLITEMGMAARKAKHKKTKLLQYYINNRLLTSFFRQIFGTCNTYNKRIPQFIYSLPRGKRDEFIKGLIDSDGHVSKKNYKINYDTVNYSLALDVVDLIQMSGERTSLSIRQSGDNSRQQFKNTKQSYKISWSNKPIYHYGYNNGNFVFCKVNDIVNVGNSSDGFVYDLTVENVHNYSTNDIVVHNSSAGSLVLYLLDATQVDPIKYDLIFERFYNKGRTKGMPDVDIDICVQRREEVMEYLKKQYGQDNVIQLATFNQLRPRQAIKSAGRILNHTFLYTNTMTDKIYHKAQTLKQALEHQNFAKLFEPQQCDEFASDKEYSRHLEQVKKNKQILYVAKGIEGSKKSVGCHPAALIILDKQNDFAVPMVRADKKQICALDMYSMQKLGFMKLDLLGSKTTSVVQKTFNDICGN